MSWHHLGHNCSHTAHSSKEPMILGLARLSHVAQGWGGVGMTERSSELFRLLLLSAGRTPRQQPWFPGASGQGWRAWPSGSIPWRRVVGVRPRGWDRRKSWWWIRAAGQSPCGGPRWSQAASLDTHTSKIGGQLLPGGHGGKQDDPLQCSCLENPRDGRAWWAAVYGVAQSRTRLKRLSSSSSSSMLSRPGHRALARSSLLRDWFPCAGAVLSLAQTPTLTFPWRSQSGLHNEM